jgi:hypothetical protein
MPIDYHLDNELNIRVATYTGVVTDEVLIQACTSLLKDPNYRPDMNGLADLSRVERLDVSQHALVQCIEMYAPIDALGVRSRLAIVAPSDVTYGLSRMYELLRGDEGPEEVHVFRDVTEAKRWLLSA